MGVTIPHWYYMSIPKWYELGKRYAEAWGKFPNLYAKQVVLVVLLVEIPGGSPGINVEGLVCYLPLPVVAF